MHTLLRDDTLTIAAPCTMVRPCELVPGWSIPQTVFLPEVCIHTLFEAQAAYTPDAIAVVFEETNDERRTTRVRRSGVRDQDGVEAVSDPRPLIPDSCHLTYGELNRRANQLAHHLRTLGVGPEVLVAVCLDRSPELIVALLAILKAGGAYVPLDPAYPGERLAFMLADSRARVLVTNDEGRTTNGLEEAQTPIVNRKSKIVNLKSDWPAIAQQPSQNLDHQATAQSAVYVIYTSGSTGQPKGVTIEHRAVLNLINWHQCAFDLSAADRATLIASPAFDASVWELWPYLTLGASLHIPAAETRTTPARLRDWLIANAISICFLPTPLAESMLALAWPKTTALRTMLTGGDQLRHFPPPNLPFALVNNYGPTENTVVTTSGVVSSDAAAAGAPDIGQPIANSEVSILDTQMRPVPVGVEGELYIGGAGLARGYLNRPDLTAARFIPNPFARVSGVGYRVSEDAAPNTRHPIPDTRLYKTGDLARYRSDGTIEFLGRIDGQVKIRGFRIELGEIEAALRRHPGVQKALVLVREDTPPASEYPERRLIAYVVLNREQGTGNREHENAELGTASLSPVTCHLSPTELRAFLAERLPGYMIPAAFVRLESFPLTPNGKIDRRALPMPGATRSDLDTTFVAPRAVAEALVAATWAQVLGMEQIGIDDNFFELGGNSLGAIQLVARLGQIFHLDLSVGALFAQPSVAGLVAGLAERLGVAALDQLAQAALEPHASGAAIRSPDEPRERLLTPTPPSVPYHFPLSFGQQQLWLHDRMAAHLPVYNEPFTIRMGGPIQVAALKRSFQTLVQRHEMLRASVVVEAGQLVQQIQPRPSVPLRVVDLQELPAIQREAAALRLATTEARRPFDLTRGPLLRATLAQLATNDNRLFITAHHISIDGVSLGVLLQELAALYQADVYSRPALLPAPRQFADFVRWQPERLTEELRAAQLGYWKQQLADLPLLNLPTDHPHPAVASFRGARQRFALAQPLSAALKALSQRAEVSLFVTLLAAFQALLAAYTGQDDIAVGTVSAGRSRPEFASLIGYLVNTLVLRSDLSGNPTFQDLLRRAHTTTVGAMDHQDVPFAQVVQALGPGRTQGASPLFQVAFVLEPPAPAVDAGWSLSQLDVDTGTTKWDLVLHLEERPEGLVGRVQYNADLFEAPTITRLIGHYQTVLAGIAANPSLRIAELSILSAAEHHQVLVEWNDPIGARSQKSEVRSSESEARLQTPDSWLLSTDDCIHELFEAQAAYTPDAIALVFGPVQLSYRELNRRANQLAHYLRRLGIGPEVRVGLSLDRSIDMIVGMLGILKAGGAYVPLDPAYPRDRLSFMLEDSRARVLVTKEKVFDKVTRRQGDKETDGAFDVILSPDHLVTRSRRTVNLDADWPIIAQQPATRPDSGATADNLAYVIYTSGSTGRPKGVLLEHRGLCNLVAALSAGFEISAASRVLQFASLSFDASVSDIFSALSSGASLHLASADTLLPSGGLLQLLRDRAITVATLPPSVLALLPPDRLPALRSVISAGESCTVEIAARWSAGRIFINAYGPTEATVCSTMSPVNQRVRDATHVPIGQPIPNTQLYLLDRHGRPAPSGVAGEIAIGGVGLARGYLNQPELTAERFIPNPFAEVSGIGYWVSGARLSDTRYPIPDTRLYKTGDLARWRADGKLEFLGRIGQQVKIRGFRIELGEIEAALSQHPAIRAAVVLAREDRPGDRRLVAYIVASEGTGDREQGIEVLGLPIGDEPRRPESTRNDEGSDSSFVVRPSSFVRELRAFLAARLPTYMIPSAFVPLDTFPMTPNGKVDRRALPAPTPARSAHEAVAATPRTPMEQMIAAIWQEVLGIDAVGLYDNFFDLGGHSLLISQVHTRLRDISDRDLAIVDLFTYPTIHALAAYLGRQPERLVTTPPPAAKYQLTLGAQRLQQLRSRKRA